MGTEKVVDVMTVSEEALALFALEDKYEFWFRSYHLVQGRTIPSPHPAIPALSTLTEDVESTSGQDGQDESSESGSSEEDDLDSDNDEDDVNGSKSRKQRVMKLRSKHKEKGGKEKQPRTKRNTLQSGREDGDTTARNNVVSKMLQELGMKPVFTSGKPQAWPLIAVNRFNTWCAYLENHRKSESCEQMQHEINLKKSKDDYLGLVIRNKRGKRSLLEMMGDDEEEVRSRVGSIFDGSSIPGSDLSTVGKVYSRYNAKYVTGNVTSIVGV